jgi:RIO kinase 1
LRKSDLDRRIDYEDEKKLDRWRIRRKRSEDSSTIEAVLDLPTSKVVHSLLGKGILNQISGIIAMGKESAVYAATPGKAFRSHFELCPTPENLVLKIYRTRTLDFHRIEGYIAGDPRFRRTGKSSIKIIRTWGQKEFKNLRRAFEAEISVPYPFLIERNVLLMEQITYQGRPAPMLKDVHFEEEEDAQAILEQLLKAIEQLYTKANLIHADLSEYNVLVRETAEAVMIDMGQSVHQTHPLAHHFLMRDLRNTLLFFSNMGIKTPDPEESFRNITGECPSPSELERI